MQKIFLTSLFILLGVFGVTITAKAVISDEFGGSKEILQEQEKNKNYNENAFDVNVSSVLEREMEKEENTKKIKENNFTAKSQLRMTDTAIEVVTEEGFRVPLQIPTGNIDVQGNKFLITSSSTGSTSEYQMKTALPAFVNQLVKSWRKENSSTTLEVFEIKVEEDKLVYEVSLAETGKLFGLIPLRLHRTVIISTEAEVVEEVKQPWYSFLVRKLNLSKIQEEEGEND
ncbi:MAG: hypothetical protein WCX70_00910 [Candidatus Paceibacterota bacterium]|jgi:hypothetical protein